MAPFPVFVDSPLSARATDIFKIHPECYDKELMQLIHSGIDVFDLPFVNYIKDCLLYTSDAADERSSVDLGGRRIIQKKKKKKNKKKKTKNKKQKKEQ